MLTIDVIIWRKRSGLIVIHQRVSLMRRIVFMENIIQKKLMNGIGLHILVKALSVYRLMATMSEVLVVLMMLKKQDLQDMLLFKHAEVKGV